MADDASSIFNKRAADKLRSPDDLDRYIRVTNPSVWIVLAACIALLAGLLAWGVFGTVSTSVTATGVSKDGNVMCFLPADTVAKVSVGDTATVGGEPLTVCYVSDIPASRSEITSFVQSDYLVSALTDDDWAYVVNFVGDSSELKDDVPLIVDIKTQQMAPIELILKEIK